MQIYFAIAGAECLRRIRRPFFFPTFRNAESVVRCAQLRLFVCVRTWQASGLRDRTAKIAEAETAAARVPGAGVQNSGVFCARSASADGGTCYFSPCLIFWCFWIKPKAQEKLRKGRTSRSILREESRVFDGASAARSPFPIFRKAERWCAARNDDYSFASAHGRPEACTIVLRKSLSVVCLSK